MLKPSPLLLQNMLLEKEFAVRKEHYKVEDTGRQYEH